MPSLFDLGGNPTKTRDPILDDPRLNRQLDKVRRLMGDENWRTLEQIAQRVGCSEAGASARLRDLRKPIYGGFTVERKRIGHPKSGHWSYKVSPRSG